MPWCEACAKFWTPSSMQPDGSCPSCGRSLASPPPPDRSLPGLAAADYGTTEGAGVPDVVPSGQGRNLSMRDIRQMAADDESDATAPWHFKLMVAALVVYLGYRAVQLVALLFR